MTGAALCYAVTTICIRVMVVEVNPAMIGALRNTFGLLFLAPLVLASGTELLATRRWPLHILRTGCAILSGLVWFWALPRVALADAVSLHFAGPIFVALAAVVLFGEVMGWRRWAAMAVGFAGILIILKPGFSAIDVGLFGAVVSAMLWAGMVLCNKALIVTDRSSQIVFLNLLIAAPVSLLIALPVWQWPRWEMVALGAVQGLLGTTAHYLVAQAFRQAPAAHVMPFDFLRLPVTAMLAFALFAEVPAVTTVLGALVIFAAATYLVTGVRQTGT